MSIMLVFLRHYFDIQRSFGANEYPPEPEHRQNRCYEWYRIHS